MKAETVVRKIDRVQCLAYAGFTCVVRRKSKRARCVSRYDNDDSDDGLSIDLARAMIGNAIPKGINAPHNLSMYIASVIYTYICVNVL